MLNSRALLLASAAGTVAQISMVVAGNSSPAVKALFAVGGMGLSLLAGLVYGLLVPRADATGTGSLALGGLIAGAVCAFIGIFVSWRLGDVPATLLALGTASSAVTGAIGGAVARIFRRSTAAAILLLLLAAAAASRARAPEGAGTSGAAIALVDGSGR